jgi:hypothetical protein
MDPERVHITPSWATLKETHQQAAEKEPIWCHSLLSIRQQLLLQQQQQQEQQNGESLLLKCIEQRLVDIQEEFSRSNTEVSMTDCHNGK